MEELPAAIGGFVMGCILMLIVLILEAEQLPTPDGNAYILGTGKSAVVERVGSVTWSDHELSDITD
ncbi:MAG: hypothetical protein ACW99J_19245 [Candidatus Thorarchaeota archaeon]|jgi:hypothetical protein